MSSKSPRGFTLVELLVVIAIIGVLVAILLPAVQAVRESARRMSCNNNIKQIALAFHLYHDSFKKLPTGGDNGPINCCSPDANKYHRFNWTFHILPYIERQSVYDMHRGAIAKMGRTPVSTYYCPTRRKVQLYQNQAKCDYAGCRGVGNNGTSVRTADLGWIAMRDVKDGLSHVLLIGEGRVHRGFMTQGITDYWSDNENCYRNGWADDVIRAGIFPPARDLLDISMSGALIGSVVHNRFGGSHPAGIGAALTDGSVRMIRFDVDQTLFRRLSIRNDRERFELDDL